MFPTGEIDLLGGVIGAGQVTAKGKGIIKVKGPSPQILVTDEVVKLNLP